MNTKTAALIAAGAAGLAAVIAVIAITLAGNGGKSPAHHRTAAAPAAAASFTAADAHLTCSKLGASALPIAAYDLRVIDEVNAITGGGNATKAQARQAHAIVAAEVRSGCPQFAYLIKQDR